MWRVCNFCSCRQTSKSAFEIVVGKGSYRHKFPVRFSVQNIGQRRAVKGVRLYHGVKRHIQKGHPVAYAQGRIEGIVAYDVARKTGVARKAVGVLFFAGRSKGAVQAMLNEYARYNTVYRIEQAVLLNAESFPDRFKYTEELNSWQANRLYDFCQSEITG